MNINLSSSIEVLEGVGSKRAALFKKEGIHTVQDLLFYAPIRYEDWRKITSIREIKINEECNIFGEIVKVYSRKSLSKGYDILSCIVYDGTGEIELVFFNRDYLRTTLKPGLQIALRGVPQLNEYSNIGLSINNPDFYVFKENDDAAPLGSIQPVYKRISSLTSNAIRKIIFNALENLPPHLESIIPEEIASRNNLMDKKKALYNLHFPEDIEQIQLLQSFRTKAQRTLIFEELFNLQLGLAFQKAKNKLIQKGIQYEINDNIRDFIRSILPFKLTNAQKKVVKEIVEDMKQKYPMNRLLQGDVGSGKTIVSLIAMLIAVFNNYQAALMAPTEILAEQHYSNISNLLSKSAIKIVLLTGSIKKKEKLEKFSDIESGKAHIIIGTHALIQENVKFHNLGFIVIDEQHRFGVNHRASLMKKGINPDVLVMTATPIPRSMALTLYGDLEISIINELPKGRKPIVTIIKKETSRNEVYNWLSQQLSASKQAYIVCPLIEESEAIQAKAAIELYEYLKNTHLKNFSVGLVHGQMPAAIRDDNMKKFLNKEYDALVATTVIEVGVDVPNATIMIIEHAERFGLSQLHQLRGRVGRSSLQSYCILIVSNKLSPQAQLRLKTIKENLDGFFIAEKDMEIRGPGELAGIKQSGFFKFKIADLMRDKEILLKARQEAFNYIEKIIESNKMQEFENKFMPFWMQRYSLMRIS